MIFKCIFTDLRYTECDFPILTFDGCRYSKRTVCFPVRFYQCYGTSGCIGFCHFIKCILCFDPCSGFRKCLWCIRRICCTSICCAALRRDHDTFDSAKPYRLPGFIETVFRIRYRDQPAIDLQLRYVFIKIISFPISSGWQAQANSIIIGFQCFEFRERHTPASVKITILAIPVVRGSPSFF